MGRARLPRPILSALGLVGYAVLLGIATGCGSIDPSPDSDGSETPGASGAGNVGGAPALGSDEALLPWATGNTWTYQVTKDGEIKQKINTIGAQELVGGVGPNANMMAFHVSTAKDMDDHTESWQAPAASDHQRVVRYREQSFDPDTGKLELEEHWDPEKLHIDSSPERTAKGASWLESYSETKLAVGLSPSTHDARDRWTVIDDDETLEVPAGIFEHVVHLRKLGGSASKDYWYARGVGKLKETGGQTEELTSYSLVDVQ